MSDEGEKTCPLCAEEMDLTDQQLKPCKCGYEVCVWCWHHIMEMAEKDGTEGRCPACRIPYDKEKIVGMAARCERVAETNTDKKLKVQKSKTKPSDGRKHLSSMRVIQRNLVYIVGLPLNLADEDLLQRRDYFGQYGKVLKVSMSRTSAGVVQQFPNNTCSVCAKNSKTKEDVAIKKIGSAFDNRIDAKRTLREIKLLCHMDHENIIKIKDIIRPPNKEQFNDVYIVYELMDTDLHQIIRSTQALTDDHCQYFLYQLLRGLKYVHSANVLHRDLKPSNLLLNSNCDLKICDFGLARTTSEADFMTEYVVTRWYRAPELLLNCSEYTAAIDVWSVGCILMEILTREPLFPGKDYAQQLELIMELLGSPDDSDFGFLRSENARKYVKQLPPVVKRSFSEKFPDASPLAIDLAERMLVFDPSKRITVDEALNHPYLLSLHEINEEPICPSPFVFDFEQVSLDEDDIKELVWLESLKFNPIKVLE